MNARLELFQDWATRYDHQVSASSFPFIGYEQALDAVIHESGAHSGSTVLELGTGTGNLAARFAALGCALVCTDFSPAMLERARTKVAGATFLEVDLTDEQAWRRLGGRFDTIAASYVLHEFSLRWNVRMLAHLAQHHLGTGGKIVLADIAFPNAATREGAQAFWSKRWDHDEHYFAADETLRELEQVGILGRYTQVSPCAGVFTLHPYESHPNRPQAIPRTQP